jgi:PEGA domain
MGWIHARRAAWSDEAALMSEFGEEAEPVDGDAIPPSFIAPPVFTPPPTMFTDAAAFDDRPSQLESPDAFDVAAVFDAEPLVAKPAKPAKPAKAAKAAKAAKPARPAVRRHHPVDAIRSLVAPLIQWALRAAPMAAVLAVVVGAGWMARPYVGTVKAWLTQLTEETTAPKPEAVVAKPAARRVAGRTGQLMARSEPPGATVLVDGKDRGVTPLTLDDLTIGSHTVVLQSEKGSIRRTVTVASDRAAVVSESIFAGWLSVFAPFEVQITEGTRAIRLDDNGKVLLPPGSHELRLENRELGYVETRKVEVQPGQTTSMSLVASPSLLTVTATAPAVVFIDGQQVGETPLTDHPIALGTRDVVVKAADGTERRFTRKVTVAPVQIHVDFSQR